MTQNQFKAWKKAHWWALKGGKKNPARQPMDTTAVEVLQTLKSRIRWNRGQEITQNFLENSEIPLLQNQYRKRVKAWDFIADTGVRAARRCNSSPCPAPSSSSSPDRSGTASTVGWSHRHSLTRQWSRRDFGKGREFVLDVLHEVKKRKKITMKKISTETQRPNKKSSTSQFSHTVERGIFPEY